MLYEVITIGPDGIWRDLPVQSHPFELAPYLFGAAAVLLLLEVGERRGRRCATTVARGRRPAEAVRLRPGVRLDQVVHSWKSYTAKAANQLLV